MVGLSYVQLGWLSSAISFAYDHALKPIFEVVSNIMSMIFHALFDHVLLPILETAFSLQIELFKTLFMNFLYNLLFRIMRVVMMALDAVERIFQTFAGLRTVYVRNETTGVMQNTGSLLEAVFRMKEIQIALIGMIGGAFVLTFMIALFATIKSAGNMGETKNTPSRVMRLTARAVLRLVLIPVLSLFLILLGDAILLSIRIAMNPNDIRMSNVIFCISTLDAVRDDTHNDAAYYNSSSRSAALAKKGAKSAEEVGDYGITDKYRRPYLIGVDEDEERDEVPLGLGRIVNDVTSFFGVSKSEGKDKNRLYVVLQDFDIARMDWFIAIGVTVVMIIMFGQLAFNALGRIFDCLLLLLVQPYFAATMPLDEGKRLEKWQDAFLGRLVSGYGTVVAVNIYFDVIALVFSGKVAFFGAGTTPAVDYITKIFFVFAGIFAIQKGGPVITGIMDANMAAREVQSYNNGEKAVMLGFKAATYPIRKAASKAFNSLLGQISGNDVSAPGGGKGEAALQNLLANEGIKKLADGGNPTPGKGDAFGKPGGGAAGPKNVQFKGKGNSPTSLGGASSTPGSAKYSGSKNQEGRVTPSVAGAGRPSGAGQAFKDKNRNQEQVKPQGGLDPKDPKSLSALNAIKEKDQKFGKAQDGLDLKDLEALNGVLGQGQEGQDQLGGLPNPAGPDSFLHAGDQKLEYDANNPYIKIGDRDEQEREERKKYEEELLQQLDEASLAGAESGIGIDLDGDGSIGGLFGAEGSINDIDGDGLDMNDILGAEKKDADMHDILGAQDPLAGLGGASHSGGGSQNSASMADLLGGQQNNLFEQQQSNNQSAQGQNNASMADLLGGQQNNLFEQQQSNNQFAQGQNNASMADLLGGQQNNLFEQQQSNNLFGQDQNNLFEQQDDILAGAMSSGASINDDPLGEMYSDPLAGMYQDPFAGMNTDPLAGMNTDPLAGMNTDPLAGMNNDPFAQNNDLIGGQQNLFGEQNNPFGEQPDPFGQDPDPLGMKDLFGNQSDPFGQQPDPYAQPQDPFGKLNDPFAQDNKNPFGEQTDPFGQDQDPLGMNKLFDDDGDSV